jgi:hypothetical protein
MSCFAWLSDLLCKSGPLLSLDCECCNEATYQVKERVKEAATKVKAKATALVKKPQAQAPEQAPERSPDRSPRVEGDVGILPVMHKMATTPL